MLSLLPVLTDCCFAGMDLILKGHYGPVKVANREKRVSHLPASWHGLALVLMKHFLSLTYYIRVFKKLLVSGSIVGSSISNLGVIWTGRNQVEIVGCQRITISQVVHLRIVNIVEKRGEQMMLRGSPVSSAKE